MFAETRCTCGQRENVFVRAKPTEGGIATKLAGPLTVVLMVALVSCSQPESVTVRQVEYIEGQHLDVHHPEGSTKSLPIVVIFHGAGLDRDDYEAFARRTARAGSVTFNADWAVLPATNRKALEQIACAVRYARDEGQALGADPDRLVLVGHSSSAVYAGEVATSGVEYTGECTVAGSALPTALALISPSQVPGGPPWSQQSLGGNPQLRAAVVYGIDDSVVRPGIPHRIEQVLSEHGYGVSLHPVEGGHFDILLIDLDGDGAIDPELADPVIEVVLSLAERP